MNVVVLIFHIDDGVGSVEVVDFVGFAHWEVVVRLERLTTCGLSK
jgi:hypothetical protein